MINFKHLTSKISNTVIYFIKRSIEFFQKFRKQQHMRQRSYNETKAMSRSGMLILVYSDQEVIIYIYNYKKLVNQNIFKNEGRRTKRGYLVELMHELERVQFSLNRDSKRIQHLKKKKMHSKLCIKIDIYFTLQVILRCLANSV